MFNRFRGGIEVSWSAQLSVKVLYLYFCNAPAVAHTRPALDQLLQAFCRAPLMKLISVAEVTRLSRVTIIESSGQIQLYAFYLLLCTLGKHMAEIRFPCVIIIVLCTRRSGGSICQSAAAMVAEAQPGDLVAAISG